VFVSEPGIVGRGGGGGGRGGWVVGWGGPLRETIIGMYGQTHPSVPRAPHPAKMTYSGLGRPALSRFADKAGISV